jgi:hypothetical protein
MLSSSISKHGYGYGWLWGATEGGCSTVANWLWDGYGRSPVAIPITNLAMASYSGYV